MDNPLFDLIVGNIDGARRLNDPERLGKDPKMEPLSAREPRREGTAEENPMKEVARAQDEAEVLEEVNQEAPTVTVPLGKTCRAGNVATKRLPSPVSEVMMKSVARCNPTGSHSRQSSGGLAASGPFTRPTTTDAENPHLGRRHRCTFCDYETDRSSHLKEHIRVHSASRSFSQAETADAEKLHLGHCHHYHHCDFCDYKTDNISNLKRHNRIHTGERPYKCHLCPQRFSLLTTLKNHVRTHTGERPYQCPSCPQTFKQSGHLRSHVRQHERQ
ncbi:zinc finger protein 628-like [Rhipicephalus sanguineus]|uniref:zinc finger protein 628-like n=1 Tax=Rhipicephalus sanguineus TaxID=34632 RepID=UPI0020C1FFB7|nr:zinc finger protein 628-like [Rhipicephalus sanguineus]